MAENTYINKVIYGDSVLVDLTADTITPETLMEGVTAHDASGAPIVGTASGGGSSILFSTGTIAVGSTSCSVDYSGYLLNFYCYDDTTGEVLNTDITIGSNSVTFSIRAAYTHVIDCVVVATPLVIEYGNEEDF